MARAPFGKNDLIPYHTRVVRHIEATADNDFKNKKYARASRFLKAIESKEMIDQTSFKRMLEIYKERFGNAADFNFVIVGSFDMEQMKQYVAQYIGSLPANKNAKKETAANDGKQIAKGKAELAYLESVLDALTRAETEADMEQLRQELIEQGYLRKTSRKPKTV